MGSAIQYTVYCNQILEGSNKQDRLAVPLVMRLVLHVPLVMRLVLHVPLVMRLVLHVPLVMRLVLYMPPEAGPSRATSLISL